HRRSHHGGVEEEAGGEQGDQQGQQSQRGGPEEDLAPAAAADLMPDLGPGRKGHSTLARPAPGPGSTMGAGTRPTAWSTTCCALRLESRPSVPRITRWYSIAG